MADLYAENPALGEEINKIILDGDKYRHRKDIDSALLCYEKAWSLVPEPKLQWAMPPYWIASSFFSAYFDKCDYEKAKEWGEILLRVKASNDTGPIVSLGMACFELRQYDEAYQYFHDAYSYGKKRAFQERPKKYLEFYLDRSKFEK